MIGTVVAVSIICIDCKKIFVMGQTEISWYRRKGFHLPKRCPECRKQRRGMMAKQLKDYTLEDALRSHDNGFAVVCEDGKPVKLTNNKGGGE